MGHGCCLDSKTWEDVLVADVTVSLVLSSAFGWNLGSYIRISKFGSRVVELAQCQCMIVPCGCFFLKLATPLHRLLFLKSSGGREGCATRSWPWRGAGVVEHVGQYIRNEPNENEIHNICWFPASLLPKCNRLMRVGSFVGKFAFSLYSSNWPFPLPTWSCRQNMLEKKC